MRITTLRLAVLALLSFAVVATTASRAESGNVQVDTSMHGIMDKAGACAKCHEEIVRGFTNNPHATSDEAKSGITVICTRCHGQGKDHIQSGDGSKIDDLLKIPVGRADEMCLSCHRGEHSMFEQSAHGARSIGCLGCHSIHAAHGQKALLKAAEPQLCFQCHADVQPAFSMRYHHKVQEGIMACTDCHDPHDTVPEYSRLMPAQEDSVCTNCHTKMAGPFKFEHPVMKTEGCSACHVPHGGSNPHLLSKADENAICLTCHMPSFNSTAEVDLNVLKVHREQSESCIDCHVDFHGSNSNATFLREH